MFLVNKRDALLELLVGRDKRSLRNPVGSFFFNRLHQDRKLGPLQSRDPLASRGPSAGRSAPGGSALGVDLTGGTRRNRWATVVEGNENLRTLGRRFLWEGAQEIVFTER